MSVIFFFNVPATTAIYTLSLHDALPIWAAAMDERKGHRIRSLAMALHSTGGAFTALSPGAPNLRRRWRTDADRKSTRLNSSHVEISYAVFCLKKKMNLTRSTT